jgi:hypothetical protein
MSVINDPEKDLVNYGKELLTDSVYILREASKTLMNLCFTSIPITIALFNYFNIKDKYLSSFILLNKINIFIPLMYLIVGVIFLLSYMPITFNIDLNVLKTIQDAHKKIFVRRLFLCKIGIVIFLLLTFVTIIVLAI